VTNFLLDVDGSFYTGGGIHQGQRAGRSPIHHDREGQAEAVAMHWAKRRRPIFRLGKLLASALLFASLPASASADLFLLRNGGQIEGEWLNREEQPLTAYQVKTSQGVVVRLHTTAVRETIRQSPEQLAYERLAPKVADTAEGHWQLAEWCRKNGLGAQRASHLRRIIELDANHQAARRALGFTFIEGEWITQSEFRREEGYELYKGRWRTAQEIEILESRAKRELAEKEWLARLRRYRLNMNDRNKAQSAIEAVRAINDPAAINPLASMLERERVRAIKTLYVDVLASINTAESAQVLVQASLSDLDEEVFYYCIKRLAEMNQRTVVESYIDALRSPQNDRVNKAAVALAQLNDRTAVSPLIEALITTHTRITPSKFGPEATAVSFGSGGSSMMSNDGPKVQIAHVKNQHVLDTLTKLSGGSNFGFDQRAWRYWYAQEKKAEQAGQQIERRPAG
jgi:hypothetical protein